jgi:hypothetical protein
VIFSIPKYKRGVQTDNLYITLHFSRFVVMYLALNSDSFTGWKAERQAALWFHFKIFVPIVQLKSPLFVTIQSRSELRTDPEYKDS